MYFCVNCSQLYSISIVKLAELSNESYYNDSPLKFNLSFNCRIDYSDLSTELAERDSHYKAKSVYEPAACACKNLKIFGVSVHLDEFPEESRTIPQVPDYPYSPPPSPGSGSSSPPLHYPHSSLEGVSMSAEQFRSPPLSGVLLPPIKVATFAGHSEIKLKLKQNSAVPGPRVSLKKLLNYNVC